MLINTKSVQRNVPRPLLICLEIEQKNTGRTVKMVIGGSKNCAEVHQDIRFISVNVTTNVKFLDIEGVPIDALMGLSTLEQW